MTAFIRVCAVVMGFGALLSLPAFAEGVGKIKTLSGDVSVERSGQVESAQLGDAVFAADVLRTESNSSVGVLLDDDSRFALGPESEFEVSKYQYNVASRSGDAELSLRHGTLSVIAGQLIDREPESLRVRTPTAVIAVRGTEFSVKVEKPSN